MGTLLSKHTHTYTLSSPVFDGVSQVSPGDRSGGTSEALRGCLEGATAQRRLLLVDVTLTGRRSEWTKRLHEH